MMKIVRCCKVYYKNIFHRTFKNSFIQNFFNFTFVTSFHLVFKLFSITTFRVSFCPEKDEALDDFVCHILSPLILRSVRRRLY